jgi:signal peptidase I
MFPLLKNNLNNSIKTDYKPCWVVEESINESDIKLGDVVAYRYGINENIMHRIISKCTYVGDNYNVTDGMATIFEKSQGYIIRGDNNGISDPVPCVPSWAIQSRFKYKLFCMADYIG